MMNVNKRFNIMSLDHDEKITAEKATAILDFIRSRYRQFYGDMKFIISDGIEWATETDHHILPLVCR